jgi:AhpD family alkylhydroperoxidase
MSRRPDIFLPYSDLSKALLLNPKHLDQKTTELAAVSAASALSSEHCIGVHIQEAAKFGASKEEIFEAIMLGTMMAMVQGQSQALRKFKEFEPLIDKAESEQINQ